MLKLLGFLLGYAVSLFAQAQDIVLRHELAGRPLDVLASQVLRFNDELKGKGRVVLQDLRGVENRQALPHLALLDPDDVRRFFDSRPRFRALHELMREGGQPFDAVRFFPQVADAVDDAAGRLQALPLALVLPVLMTNRAALRRAGVDPDAPVKTWWELQKVAGEIYDHGGKCPLTSSRFAWIHAENVAAQAGEPVMDRVGNHDRLMVNGLINVKHLALLASWQKSRYFHYSGPDREGDRRFLSGECAMLTGESSLYADAVAAGIDLGVMPLPHYDDAYAPKPAELLPDGAGLWALAGHRKDEYRLAARFVSFLMRPEVQKEWVQATSYLPMTPGALAALRESAIPPQLLDAAQKRLSMPRKRGSRTRHGPVRDHLREFLGEEVVFVWNQGRPAKEALDNVARRVNELLAPPAKAAAARPK